MIRARERSMELILGKLSGKSMTADVEKAPGMEKQRRSPISPGSGSAFGLPNGQLIPRERG